jgi:hypothetical protein
VLAIAAMLDLVLPDFGNGQMETLRGFLDRETRSVGVQGKFNGISCSRLRTQSRESDGN